MSHILVNVDHDDSDNHVNVDINDDLNSFHFICVTGSLVVFGVTDAWGRRGGRGGRGGRCGRKG